MDVNFWLYMDKTTIHNIYFQSSIELARVFIIIIGGSVSV